MRRRRWILVYWMLLVAPLAWSRTYHYSMWSDDPTPYLTAVQKSRLRTSRKVVPSQSIRAGIVTHHFLASGLMVRFFESLRAGSSPGTIILVGPNHFHHGREKISLSSLPWKTPFGVLETDRSVTRRIEAATNVSEDPEAFTGEHSVGVLVPWLKYYFPRCHVVPILIDSGAEEAQIRALRTVLAGSLVHPRVLVVLSMDFSHNSTSEIADMRDKEAEQVISKLDASRVDGLHVDCHKGLWILLSWLKSLRDVNVRIEEHTNSSRLSNNPTQKNATSYFTMLFLAQDKRKTGSLSVP